MRKYIDIANKLLERGVIPADFEARYVRGESPPNRRTEQGLGGVQYVDFVPLTRRAKLWLDVKGHDEQPRVYGAYAAMDFEEALEQAGMVVAQKEETAKNS